MNKVCLIGRITKDLELRYNNSNVPVLSFTIAVDRSYTNEKGERETDFINCVAWRKTAELISQYFSKGSQIGIEGRIQTGSYENNKGEKVYTTNINVENITFLSNKNNSTKQESTKTKDDPFEEFGEIVEIDNGFLD